MKRLFILGAVVLLSACSSAPSSEGGLTGFIRVDGSSTVYPVTEAVAEEFLAAEPGVRVTVGLSGTGGGFKKFCRGETDINDASRPIKQREVDACAESGIDYVGLTVAYDGLAILAHPENDWLESIGIEELKKIWEPDAQGVVTKWNQIREEWPDEEISLYGPGTASGTFDYFTEAVVGESGSSRGDYTASEDDNVLVQGIATNKYALGFFGLAYYEENKDKLKLVALENEYGVILPSEETVKSGTYTPLSRPLFIYINSTALEREEGKVFSSFYLEQVGGLSGEVGYVPLSDEEYAEQKVSLETFVTSLSSTDEPVTSESE